MISPPAPSVERCGGRHVELSGSDIEVLDLIGRYGPMTPRPSVPAPGSTRPHSPACSTGSERGGWLVRRPDPDDRRRVQVRPGSTGRRNWRPLCTHAEVAQQDLLNFTLDQLEVVAGFLGRLPRRRRSRTLPTFEGGSATQRVRSSGAVEADPHRPLGSDCDHEHRLAVGAAEHGPPAPVRRAAFGS